MKKEEVLEDLVQELSKLILKYENAGLIEKGCDYILTPWGCVVRQHSDLTQGILRRKEGTTLYSKTVLDLPQYNVNKNPYNNGNKNSIT